MRRTLAVVLGLLIIVSTLSAPDAPVAASEASAAASSPDPSGSRPVYRFWSTTFDNAHFYTVNAAEAVELHAKDSNWTYEGQDFRVWPTTQGSCSGGTVPVHRFWSSVFESHFFTTSAAEADQVRQTDKNWTYEGIAFCTAPQDTAGTVPVYRFWSPSFRKHFYTANAAEAQKLRSSDPNWNDEGVALYAPASGPSFPDLRAPHAPVDTWNCPAGYPVKGNHSSSGELIYHVPGGQYYDKTNPEECFATPQDAENAGYRASKR